MIKFDIENRVAVVTGGAQGFGLAITERFIESGAKVVIWDIDENEAKKASPDRPEVDPEAVDEEDEDPTSKVI